VHMITYIVWITYIITAWVSHVHSKSKQIKISLNYNKLRQYRLKINNCNHLFRRQLLWSEIDTKRNNYKSFSDDSIVNGWRVRWDSDLCLRTSKFVDLWFCFDDAVFFSWVIFPIPDLAFAMERASALITDSASSKQAFYFSSKLHLQRPLKWSSWWLQYYCSKVINLNVVKSYTSKVINTCHLFLTFTVHLCDTPQRCWGEGNISILQTYEDLEKKSFFFLRYDFFF